MVSAPPARRTGAHHCCVQVRADGATSDHRSILNISRLEAPEFKAKPRKAPTFHPALKAAAGRWDRQGLILISVRVSFIPVNYCHKITPIY